MPGRAIVIAYLSAFHKPRRGHTGLVSNSRLSSAEARDQLVAIGIELLSKRGLRMDPLGIELTEAIAASNVPRSSAYRAFKHETLSAQEAFAQAVSTCLISLNTHGDVTGTIEVAMEVISSRPDLLENGTKQELAFALRQLIRRSTDANVSGLEKSPLVWLYLGTLIAVGQSDQPMDHPLVSTLRSPDRIALMVNFYRDMLESFGLRLRSGWSYERLDAAISATMLGYGARMIVDPLLRNIMRPTGSDGEEEPWTMAAIAIEGLVLAAAEPNPRVVNAADLSSWID